MNSNKIVITKKIDEIEVLEPDYDFNVNELYIEELKHFFHLINKNIYTHSLDFNHALSNTELMLKMYNNE